MSPISPAPDFALLPDPAHADDPGVDATDCELLAEPLADSAAAAMRARDDSDEETRALAALRTAVIDYARRAQAAAHFPETMLRHLKARLRHFRHGRETFHFALVRDAIRAYFGRLD